MAEVSRLENQLSLLTEQLVKLNTTTKEQFKQSKLGSNYNPFSSAFAAPAYSTSMYLDGNPGAPIRIDKVKGRYNPFSHNRLDGRSATSDLLYLSPQDRVRSDTNQVSDAGRKASGVAEAGAGILGAKAGSTAGQAAGAWVASSLIGGKMGLALSTLLVGSGMLLGGAVGGAVGAAAFKSIAGTDQRIAANAVHQYMMENSFRFMNPNQSSGTNNPLGAGFSYKDSRELSREIPLMTDDLNVSTKTLMELTKTFTEGDLMKGVNTTKDFTKRFKDLTETAKDMAYLLNDSIEDAGKFMSDLQLRGFDQSKLTNQAAKMRNLSQFLGKDVSQVAQTAVDYASNSVAGTNMDFTVALGNQTYATGVMNRISDAYLKEGKEEFKPAFDLIKNMDGPEAAANVFGKVMASTLVSENGMQNQALMAAATYDAENDTWGFDSKKLKRFIDKGFTFGEGHAYAEKAITQEYVSAKRRLDPNFETTTDNVYAEFFSNRQRIAGGMDSKDQVAFLKSSLAAMRKESPDQLKHMSDKSLLQQGPFGFDETTAELAVAMMKMSDESFSQEYENSGLVSEYVARQKANNTGLVGKVKRFGSKIGNALASAGMRVTAPIQDLADMATKAGSDFLFGNKDFNYQEEFGVKDEVLKKYFADSSGDVDPAKIGKNFYEMFEKGLQDAQKKGTVVSKLLLSEVSAMAKSVVKTTSAEASLSGEDYKVQRWTSKEGLSDYAKQNYDVIQQTAVKNKISDQALGYIGSTRNMSKEQLEKAAPELQRLMEAYGGNETLAIAAFEKGQAVVDESLKMMDIDIQGFREAKDFTEFNSDEDVSKLAAGYAKEMEKTAGASATTWQGKDRTIQSKSRAKVISEEEKKSNSRDMLIGAIELTKAGLSSADSEAVLDARLEAVGIEVTPGMSKAEKEALAYVEGDFDEKTLNNIADLQHYATWGVATENFAGLSQEEKRKTIDAYLFMMAGRDKMTEKESRAFDVIKTHGEKIMAGEGLSGTSAGATIKGAVNSAIVFGDVDTAAVDDGYDEINSSTIAELEKKAKSDDAKQVADIIKAQTDAKMLVRNISFEGKSSEEKVEGRRKIMSALYSGDQAQLDLLAKEYDLSDDEKKELTRLGALKVGDTGISLLSLDANAAGTESQDATQALVAKTRHDYSSAKVLLEQLGFDKEYIENISIADEDFENTDIRAIEASRRALVEIGSSAIAGVSNTKLNEILRNGQFSEEELADLTNDAGGNMNPLILNQDGTYSFNEAAMSRGDASKIIAEHALEEFAPGVSGEGSTAQADKGEEAKKGLGDATESMIATMEATTDVMIRGTDKLIKRQEKLAKQLDVDIPAVKKSDGSTSGNG